MEPVIFHIDVNSAFLSWSAADRAAKHILPDLRTIPAAVGGDSRSRRGVVLAKSIPAKAYGVRTGEALFTALQKCPSLKVIRPSFHLYEHFSRKMYEICNRFSPFLQRYSIDELFLDYTNMEPHFGPPEKGARLLADTIKTELGFTVNVGISTNKLLAKMASDFEKPDKVHTLYRQEIPQKMWPLPVTDLFMIGGKTAQKLAGYGVHTIGQLAACSQEFLYYHFKTFGRTMWQFANGIDSSPVSAAPAPPKSIGNGTTTPVNITNIEAANVYLLSLSEKAAARLRQSGLTAGLVEVSLRDSKFKDYSRQKKYGAPLRTTNQIYTAAKEIFLAAWKKEPLRAVSVRLGDLSDGQRVQCSFFEDPHAQEEQLLDQSVDRIRAKFGSGAILRAALLNNQAYQNIQKAGPGFSIEKG